ncbi:uncharacterized protein LY89DRAFT_596060 [Mollisia scopiformis]|uniref:Zn(2)-C6 fungal-type domain-containing protein n=1 Tax=Mollisia scopiformis TaxID=149040 RepID=A0A194WS71_MOLSC|nr:uncharacterized protein LY89DRAFT_596060 [Mollisia scopiformis]KUJ10821.1 hypothetical protein LY89DRAFT_596060 [Mollisia scopiformis]
MANDSSAPYQLVPTNSYNTELLQDTQSSFQPPNDDARLDRIQFGNQQHIPPAAPSQQNHTTVESDPIPSNTEPNPPKTKKIARRTKVTASRAAAPARVEKQIDRGKKPRRSFDLDERAATACTRELGSCARCKMQKSRCVRNPLNPDGPCMRCLSDSAIINIPCLRKKIPDARFTPAKDCPEPYWTTRWATMDVKEIDVWASSEVRTLVLTQDIGSAKDVLTVRMIVPLPGDSLTRTWMSKSTGERFHHQTAPWAIMNMTRTAHEPSVNIDNYIEDFINHFVNPNDKLLVDTYLMAFRLSTSSKVEEERVLLRNVLRLWVAARRGTKPQRVIGEEKLGMLPQTLDRNRYDYGEVPVPPVISAQLSLLREALIIRPWTQEVRSQLEALVAKKKPESWLTVYLVMFILLHNCSLLTAYFMKKAKNLRLHDKYHAIAILEELHFSVSILLTYYHYVNKGALCFATGHASSRDIQRLKLDDDQLSFLIFSAKEVKRLEPSMKKAREESLFHHEYYFISQLYDLNWVLPEHTVASVQ